MGETASTSALHTLGDLDVLLINGELRAATGGQQFVTYNPATEAALGVVADATGADMDAAIAAARTAFDQTNWSRDIAFRAHCIRQLADALERHGAALRALTTAEVGAPSFLTHGPQFDIPAADLRYYADLAENYDNWKVDLGEARPVGVKSQRWVFREPVGVVGAITPWNFPHQITFAKIGPALAAGCTVVLKPAPDTPWCASALARIIARETDFPDGVINIVTSSDHALGAQLSADPRVDLVSFTGSTTTGKAVMKAAADNITQVFLELGGKSAFIVLDDADVAAAGSLAAFTVATHAGQGCAITTRLVVPAALHDAVVDAAAATLEMLQAGDPTDRGTVCGPVISQQQRDRIEGYFDIARSDGGSFAVGGQRPDRFDSGWWVDPALIVGLDNASRVAQEEIFGPVLTVIPVGSEAEAIQVANDSPFGLSGAVYSSDEERALNVAAQVRTGTLAINGGVWYNHDTPFGGYKQSGIGREMGVAGFEEYLLTKAVAVAR